MNATEEKKLQAAQAAAIAAYTAGYQFNNGTLVSLWEPIPDKKALSLVLRTTRAKSGESSYMRIGNDFVNLGPLYEEIHRGDFDDNDLRVEVALFRPVATVSEDDLKKYWDKETETGTPNGKKALENHAKAVAKGNVVKWVLVSCTLN